MAASTAATDRAALGRSRRPASGSRNSGSSTGPRASSTAITGRATRNTDPHQNHSSSSPPSIGPMAAPAEKLEIQTPTATVRWRGSTNMLRISERVEGARVAPARPGRARGGVRRAAGGGNGRTPGAAPEGRPARQQQPAPADPVAKGAHGDQGPGGQ